MLMLKKDHQILGSSFAIPDRNQEKKALKNLREVLLTRMELCSNLFFGVES